MSTAGRFPEPASAGSSIDLRVLCSEILKTAGALVIAAVAVPKLQTEGRPYAALATVSGAGVICVASVLSAMTDFSPSAYSRIVPPLAGLSMYRPARTSPGPHPRELALLLPKSL